MQRWELKKNQSDFNPFPLQPETRGTVSSSGAQSESATGSEQRPRAPDSSTFSFLYTKLVL